MKHVIIGTAGHVDHGKTTLIQTLTGSNPDRLKEEQERGMTIDIGFAALRLPDGTIAGIVDVPGHERFLKNMLAGASGVDVVLLVIAADESVMPQTSEHLDILKLLDVKNGVIALTKSDLVDAEWLDAVEEDIRDALKDSFLENAPIIRVSSVTGKGIDALKRALMASVSRAESRNASMPLRLPIDRVFTRPGFGTVVTGTLVAGSARIGDSVEISPQRIRTRIRGLQVHGSKVEVAEAGSRVAINLAGVETDAISRGAQLAAPNSVPPTTTFDAVLRLLPHAPKALADRARVRVHIGTAEIIGRMRLLGPETELEPGGRGYVQFRAEGEFACTRGDRIVVRTYSPMATIGGGIVLDPAPLRHRKGDASMLASLAAKEIGTPEDLLETLLQRYTVGLLKKDLMAQAALPQTEFDRALVDVLAAGKVVLTQGDRLFHSVVIGAHTDRIHSTLEQYHSQFPLRAGMPKEEMRAALGRDIDPRSFASLLAHWQSTDAVVVEAASVRLPAFTVELNERQQALLGRIEEVYRDCFIAIPDVEEVARAVKAPPDAVNALLKVGLERGRFVRVQDGAYYHRETVDEVMRIVREYVTTNGGISVGAFRDLTNSNRKFSLTALEYLDSVRYTRRSGDERILY